MSKRIYICPHCLSKWYTRRNEKGGKPHNGRFYLYCLSCGRSFSTKEGINPELKESLLTEGSET